jgi:hypothetical protein
MALKVTGSLDLGKGASLQNPLIKLNVHMPFAGQITVDCDMFYKESAEVAAERSGSFGIHANEIPLVGNVKKAHDAFLAAVEVEVAKIIAAKNPSVTIETVASSAFNAVVSEQKEEEEEA